MQNFFAELPQQNYKYAPGSISYPSQTARTAVNMLLVILLTVLTSRAYTLYRFFHQSFYDSLYLL